MVLRSKPGGLIICRSGARNWWPAACRITMLTSTDLIIFNGRYPALNPEPFHRRQRVEVGNPSIDRTDLVREINCADLIRRGALSLHSGKKQLRPVISLKSLPLVTLDAAKE